MLRASYAEPPVRKAAERFLPDRVARQVGWPDLATVFEHPDGERLRSVGGRRRYRGLAARAHGRASFSRTRRCLHLRVFAHLPIL